MLANITFKAYESKPYDTNKDTLKPVTEFTLLFADTDKIDKVCQAIESAYEYDCISWTINIDHNYI
jgi:hypothetical protein